MLFLVGADFPEGPLVSCPELEKGRRQAPADSGQPPRRRKVHGELVPIQTGQQTGSQETDALALRRRPDLTAPMRIALLGTRGIPAHYGGFETFAEELSTRLVARGHRLTVYCREHTHSSEF